MGVDLGDGKLLSGALKPLGSTLSLVNLPSRHEKGSLPGVKYSALRPPRDQATGCSVGGGCYGSPRVGKLHGMGCLLDKSHVLTAAHCWTGVKDNYEWPAVATLDGLFRCDVAFYSEESDILSKRAW
jgi:hypothetical protein